MTGRKTSADNLSSKQGNLVYYYRIIFTFLILHLHYYAWTEGKTGGFYLAVEFFFIVSGYLLAKDLFDKEKLRWEISTFVKNKISRYYPAYVSALIIMSVPSLVHGHLDPIRFLVSLFGLQIFNLSVTINTPDWYIIVLFWLSISMFILFKTIPDKSRVVVIKIAGIIAILLLRVIIRDRGNIDIWGMNKYYIPDGVIRGTIDIWLGFVLYELVEYFGKINKIKDTKWLFVVSVISTVLGIFLSIEYSWSEMDFWIILLYMLALFLAFLPKTMIKVNENVLKISDITIYIYLNHAVFVRLFQKLCGNEFMHRGYIFIAFNIVVVLFSVFVDFSIKKLNRFVRLNFISKNALRLKSSVSYDYGLVYAYSNVSYMVKVKPRAFH